jgi:hypothetical protein
MPDGWRVESGPRWLASGEILFVDKNRLWTVSLAAGQPRRLTTTDQDERSPAEGPDGTILYASIDENIDIYTMPLLADRAIAKGAPMRITSDPSRIAEENVGQGSFQWAASGNEALYFHRAPPGTVGLLHLPSRQRTPILRHRKFNLSLADARLSPDGRWIAFPVPYAPHRSRLAVAPVTGNLIEEERDWTYLTPEDWNASQPEWSPNGQWLYFPSDQTGALAVHALPLSPEKKAKAAPRLVLDLANTRATIAGMRPRDIGLAIAKDKLALGAASRAGKLWSVRLPVQ